MSFKKEFNIVGFFYVVSILYFFSLGSIGAYRTLYFLDLGFSYSIISLIFLMSPISSLIFEIPSGTFADVFGRKYSVFLSFLIHGLAFVGILLSGRNLSLLILFYFMIGFSLSFMRGALDSWFIDTVHSKSESRYLHKLLGRWKSVSSLGYVIGAFLAGILAKYGIGIIFWTASISMLFSALFVFIFGKEEYFKRKRMRIGEMFRENLKMGKNGFKQAFGNSTILILMFIAALFMLANTIVFNAYQPHVVEVGLERKFLGFALSIASFISIFIFNYSYKIVKFIGGNKRSLLIFTFLFGATVLGIGSIRYLPLLFLNLVLSISIGGLTGENAPAFRELFNSFVPSKIRATVISINSFNMVVGKILGLIIFGLISDYFDLQSSIIFAGILITTTSLIYLKVKE